MNLVGPSCRSAQISGRRSNAALPAPWLVSRSERNKGLSSPSVRPGFPRSRLLGAVQAGSFLRMSTVELITRKTRTLPAELQQEALHYVDYLLARQTENTEAREWSRFSAEQLAAQYAPADALYDED